ncbi:hypothetical protein [Herminiimonas sp. CN]|uniref:hypothetical protein n=1 Tax=Herminiimonas sp. CN TaxID=1349818 RepID=UPI001EE63EFF|nr:hypothetical protein [Herminiimonas sp. CN]
MLLLALAAGFRSTLERSMPLHMLLQMPLLLGAGIVCAFAASCVMRDTKNRRLHGVACLASGHGRKFDEYGIVGLTFLLLLSAYWMIPKALDEVLVSPAAELLKFTAFFIAGLMLPGTLARANRVTQLFFLGNFAWMMAIVGMLYQDTSVRLCNAYLLDDQLIAGQGLVALSIAIPALWFIRVIRNGIDK